MINDFLQLFDPRRDVYGIGKGDVRREPVGTTLIAEHFAGVPDADVGFFPLRDDGTVRFAAIDLDEPDFQLAIQLAGRIPGNAWVERSRSGNAHVWVFFDRDCPAWVARGILRTVTEAFELPRVEIFPKQADLLPGMVGNYISAPYFHGADAEKQTRPMVWWSGEREDAVAPLDKGFGLREFLTVALNSRVDVTEWENRAAVLGLEPPRDRAMGGEEWGTRTTPHVCATYMLEHKDDNPLTPGHRATVLFNLAKQLSNVEGFDEDTVVSMVDAMNTAGTEPIKRSEVERFVRNAFRGQWVSTGCDDPLMEPYVSPDCPIANG